jgi:hypothetical protein
VDREEIVRTSIVLATGLALIASAVGVTLAGSPSTLAGTNAVPAASILAASTSEIGACQSGETLPAGTTAIRLSLSAIIGARVSVTVLSGTHVIAHGTHGTGWSGAEVTVPVARVARAVPHVTTCFALSELNGKVSLIGEPTPPSRAAVTQAGQPLRGRFRTEDVGMGRTSWLSLASSVARHFSLGRSPSGMWIVFFAATAVLGVIAITSWLIVREL